MTSWSLKKFPVRVSETKRVNITLACFRSLTAADLSPKDDFDQLFNFQGPVISECTIVFICTILYFNASLTAVMYSYPDWPEVPELHSLCRRRNRAKSVHSTPWWYHWKEEKGDEEEIWYSDHEQQGSRTSPYHQWSLIGNQKLAHTSI